MDYSVKDFYVPTVTYFESGNFLTGSRTGMNYKMVPYQEKGKDESGKEVKIGDPKIVVKIWYGKWNLDHSELVAQSDYPMVQDSMKQIEDWLYQQYDIYMQTPLAAQYIKYMKDKER